MGQRQGLGRSVLVFDHRIHQIGGQDHEIVGVFRVHVDPSSESLGCLAELSFVVAFVESLVDVAIHVGGISFESDGSKGMSLTSVSSASSLVSASASTASATGSASVLAPSGRVCRRIRGKDVSIRDVTLWSGVGHSIVERFFSSRQVWSPLLVRRKPSFGCCLYGCIKRWLFCLDRSLHVQRVF
jgi:hypothetical protein